MLKKPERLLGTGDGGRRKVLSFFETGDSIVSEPKVSPYGNDSVPFVKLTPIFNAHVAGGSAAW